MMFHDRKDAGKKLAEVLKKYKGTDAVVYALPRGGVIIGLEIARALNIPLDMIVARKIGHPDSPEYAIAAVTENGTQVENAAEVGTVDKEWYRRETEAQHNEALRRRKAYGSGKKQIPAAGKIAIVVDDGLATGLTMKAALTEIRKKSPKKIVMAVPVAPKDALGELKKLADEIIVLDAPEFYLGAVGAYYHAFPQVSDEEVINIMKRS